jgi:competence protein ComEA
VGEGAKWQVVAAAAAAALAVFALVRMLDRPAGRGGGEPVRVSRDGSRLAPSGGAGDRGASRHRGPVLVVHVAGSVRRPGVYRVPGGARVAGVVARAGGVTRRADLTAVNLAAPLEDGQQVIVPARIAAGADGVAGTAAQGEAPISLATASAEDLEELDGIGETIAERIVEYRDEQGGLRSLDELGEVDGIGEKRLEALKEALRP